MSLLGFHPIIQEWFRQRVGTPTEIQTLAWPMIQQGRHVLVTAPTGCGKTLTAFLWAIHQLASGVWEPGQTRVLYISPLKALNNDIQRNLLTPLEELRTRFAEQGQALPEIHVQTRSGDTPAQERQRMQRRPPEILITTPESLNILLTAKTNHRLLSGIRTVILDEIHAVVDTKRGTHLITAVDRLVLHAGEFQRIALSATVKPLDLVATFVGGYIRTEAETYTPRPVAVVESSESKTYSFGVDFPEDAREQLVDDSWWPVLAERCREILQTHDSTLLFANSRRLVEKVARLINEAEGEILVYAHHGSLSKEIRLTVEQRLKQGRLSGIVATNSLELGIDIGSLDEVILIQTPFSVAATVQRLGRAGHGVGQVSKGTLFPTHGSDFLAAAVMARAVATRDIESVQPIRGALDVLTQVILSLCVTRTWNLDEMFAFLKTSFPFHELPRRHFDLVIQMLEGRYADTRVRELKPRVIVDRLDHTIRARESAAFLLYMAGGTIPDRGYYDLRLQGTQAKLGELDEEFVWERSVGETFALGNQVWRIQRITHNDVEVTPEVETLNIIPFWKADARDSSFHFAAKIAEFLEQANARLDEPEFQQTLEGDYHMSPTAADELLGYLQRQREASGADLPHRHHLLIERFQQPTEQGDAQQVIVHTFWGGQVNRPFALALSMAWQQAMGSPLQVFVNNEAVLCMLPSLCEVHELLDLLTPENVESHLTGKLEQTGFFGAHFRENAGRALLLPKQNFRKRMPLWLNRLRSKKLLQTVQGFSDFPILIETWRSCLHDHFDLPHLKECLEKLHTREIRTTVVETHHPSPFADGLIWRQTNQFMYEDDTPLAADRVSLQGDLLRDLLFSSHLRPRLPQVLIDELQAKRQRTTPGYTPTSPDELLEHIKDRLLIPPKEWSELAAAIRRDIENPDEWTTMLHAVDTKLACINWPDSAGPFITAREDAPRIRALLVPDQNVTVMDLTGHLLPEIVTLAWDQPDEEADTGPSALLGQWLSFYGPMPVETFHTTFSLPSFMGQQVTEDLIDSEQVVLDLLSENASTPEVCDVTNLEILLRMLRRSRQPGFVAWPVQELPLFIAAYQGLTRRGNAPEDLQRVLEQLFGLSLSPQLWEEVVFPSRLSPYHSTWLDSLIQEHGLVLLGQPDKKLSFVFPEDLDLFQTDIEPAPSDSEPSILPASPGRFSLLDLAQQTTRSSAELTGRLWQEFWQGRISVDAFVTLRKGIVSKFKVSDVTSHSPSRRRSFRRWRGDRPLAGHWYRLPRQEAPDDPMEAVELNKDRVRQLLTRYGILFRELLQRELPGLQWRSVFRSLRLMEFSGEVITGRFFDGLADVQFMSPVAFERLQQGLPDDAIFWINACDPASLCGVDVEDLKSTLPKRLVSNFIVYHGSQVTLTIQKTGKALNFDVAPGHPRMSEFLSVFRDLLTRDFNPRQKIIVETVNEIPVLKSPYLNDLQQYGFEKNVDRMELWKRY